LYRSDVLSAITYLGNVSHRNDSAKVANCGLTMRELGGTVGFAELPVHYDCRIVARVPLGTHCMFLGKVENVLVRADLTPENPLEGRPWAGRFPPCLAVPSFRMSSSTERRATTLSRSLDLARKLENARLIARISRPLSLS